MKKILSLVLALSLLLAMGLMPAAAAEGSYTKLTWVMGTGADAPADLAMVTEELNKISREKLGCEVEFVYMINEQVLTSIQSGEVYDMYFTCDWYNDYVTQSYAGIFADITEAVKTVTPDLYATMPEIVWEGAKVNGKIYAIPVKKDYAPEIYAIFDKTLVEEFGLTFDYDIEWADIEPYLAKFKEKYPDRYAFEIAKSPSGLDGSFDFINRTALIGLPYDKVGTDEATKVVTIFDDEETMNRFRLMNKWYQLGYINPDAATTQSTDSKVNFFKIGQGFYGADSIWSSSYGYPVTIARLSGPYLSASGVRGSMNAISAATQNLDLCLKYQELVNTDQKYRDILRYGVEGYHFNYNEDGTVTRTDIGSANYTPWQFSQGSYALSSVEASNFAEVPVDPDMWKKIFEMYDTDAVVAADFGFSFDPTDYEMQISQISVVKDKWMNLIYTGTVNVDEVLDEVMTELKAAGIDDVIAGAQAQLDAYLASKNA